MEKNVLVVDENGNEYGATYPKRAKGLVKNGRARFMDEHTICLACPPDKEITEDISMTDNNINNIEQSETIITETAPELTVEYILAQIKAIQENDAYLYSVVNELGQVHSEGPGDIGAQEKAEAFGSVVHAREATNRELIAFYMKMYDSLQAENTLRERCLEIALTAARNPAGCDFGELNGLLNNIRQIGH